MLRDEVLNVADDLRDLISSRGMYVEPKQGSVLAELVSAAAPVLPIGFYGGRPEAVLDTDGAMSTTTPLAIGELCKGPNCVSVLTESSLEKTPVGDFRHGAVLETVLELAVRATRVDQDFARNGVNPVIRSIVEAVEASENSRAGEAGLRPDLVPYFYADLWDSASWNALVARFADQPIVKVYIRQPIELPEDVKLFDLVTDGLPGNDEQLKALIQNHSEEWVNHVWRAVFCNDSEAAWATNILGRSDEDGWFFSPNRLSVDAVIVAFLMARSLLKREPSRGYSAQDWDAAISSVIGAAGQRLYRATKQRAEDRATQQLVFSYDYREACADDLIFSTAVRTAGRGVIVINGDLYNDYLERGGSPEALMGASYSKQSRKLDELLVINEQLQEAYRRHEQLISERYNAQQYTRVLETLRTEIMKYISTIPEDQAIRTREAYVAMVRSELALFATRDIGALWYFVRRLVCRVFFPHTNALRVLEKIDEVAERMPNASVQVASYHATIEILIDWFWEQLEIKPAAGA